MCTGAEPAAAGAAAGCFAGGAAAAEVGAGAMAVGEVGLADAALMGTGEMLTADAIAGAGFDAAAGMGTWGATEAATAGLGADAFSTGGAALAGAEGAGAGLGDYFAGDVGSSVGSSATSGMESFGSAAQAPNLGTGFEASTSVPSSGMEAGGSSLEGGQTLASGAPDYTTQGSLLPSGDLTTVNNTPWDTLKSGYNSVNEFLSPVGGVKGANGIRNVASGLYDMYAKNQMAKQQQSYMNGLSKMYAPGSPEATQMQREMEARDAAAGRRSQYGTRAVQLNEALAGKRSGIMTSPGYTSAMNAGMQNKYGALNSMFGYLNQSKG